MGKWAERLAESSAAPLPPGTDRTDKRGLLSVLAVTPEGGAPELDALAPHKAEPVAEGLARLAASEVLALSAEAATQCCADCCRLLRHGTCSEPVAAGLLTAAEGFGIVWPPTGHGVACLAFQSLR